MSPMPSVNQAYGMIISDKGQKIVAENSGILGASPASSSSNLDMPMFTRNDSARYKKNYNLQSEFYKMKGHTKDVCYKLVGYPSDFNKFIKKGVQTWNNGYNSNARAHNVMTDQLQASEQCDMMGDPFENIAEENKEDHKGKRVSYKVESSSHNRNFEMGLYPFFKGAIYQIVSLLKNMSDN